MRRSFAGLLAVVCAATFMLAAPAVGYAAVNYNDLGALQASPSPRIGGVIYTMGTTEQHDQYTVALQKGSTIRLWFGVTDGGGELKVLDPSGSTVASCSAAEPATGTIPGYLAPAAGIYKVDILPTFPVMMPPIPPDPIGTWDMTCSYRLAYSIVDPVPDPTPDPTPDPGPLASSVTIKTSATSARIGQTPILSGVLTPTACIGRNMTALVMKPGKTYWTYSSNRTVYSRYGVPSWQYKYYFKRGMTKGTYKFKAILPAGPGYASSVSPTTVAIKLQ
jgi:hypothetical protein